MDAFEGGLCVDFEGHAASGDVDLLGREGAEVEVGEADGGCVEAFDVGTEGREVDLGDVALGSFDARGLAGLDGDRGALFAFREVGAGLDASSGDLIDLVVASGDVLGGDLVSADFKGVCAEVSGSRDVCGGHGGDGDSGGL